LGLSFAGDQRDASAPERRRRRRQPSYEGSGHRYPPRGRAIGEIEDGRSVRARRRRRILSGVRFRARRYGTRAQLVANLLSARSATGQDLEANLNAAEIALVE